MKMLTSFVKCIFGPRLIKIYATSGKSAVNYAASSYEKLGDAVLRMMNLSLQLGIYTSPIVIWILYKRSYLSYDGFHTLFRLTVLCTAVCASSLAIRAFGRVRNQDYVKFIQHLDAVKFNYSTHTKKLLSQYDFDFSAWPVEYDAKDIEKDADKPRIFVDHTNRHRSITELARAVPCQILGYLVAHSFGIRLLYPGTIIQHFIEPHLIDGRARFIEGYSGQRFKLVSKLGNAIDTMVIDRRGRPEHANGEMLVICCEGNAGFYEVGMLGVPIEAGFSVIGWNHPGFGGSTGAPFPREEQHAVDIVVQFALNKLKFPAESIIIYGWSIGGFTASWAAMNYPNVRAVMLDATFDHVLPLAANVMPASWKSIVATTVKNNMNLNVAEQLIKYPGPVMLFRRTRDEVIALEPGSLSTNRGNDLLIKLLKYRYPNIVNSDTITVIREWLDSEGQERDRLMLGVNAGQCARLLQQFIDENSNTLPMKIGHNWTDKNRSQMALFLASRHLQDFDSTHCTPLPTRMFRLPQDVGLESEFVEISDFVEIAPSDC